MIKKKVDEKYKNPEIEIGKRPFVAKNDKNYKQMMKLMIEEIKQDKNSEFKFCVEHLFISSTRAGSKLHKSCNKVYTANHMKGNHLIRYTHHTKIGKNDTETQEKILALIDEPGHFNQRGHLKQFLFYSLFPNSTKYHLTQDQTKKRKIEEISESTNPLESSFTQDQLKKMKNTSKTSNHPSKPSVQYSKTISKKDYDEENELLDDPRVQAIIAITFHKMDEVNSSVAQQVQDLTLRINQFENKITAIANKVRSIKVKQALVKAPSALNKTGKSKNGFTSTVNSINHLTLVDDWVSNNKEDILWSESEEEGQQQKQPKKGKGKKKYRVEKKMKKRRRKKKKRLFEQQEEKEEDK